MQSTGSASAAAVEAIIDDLLSQMTLKEKVSLLSGRDLWRTNEIPRLGIRSLTMTDGPHGVRAEGNAGGRTPGPATSYPTGVSMGASWNPDLVRRVGAALAEETRQMGCDLLLAPCVNIVRTPLAGRNFETYSEDPFLSGRLGAAYVQGVQSQGIGTSLKHFAANNQEIERHRGSSVVDERTLREIYLPQFEAVVKEAQPWTVMCSYNRINGEYASQNGYLLNQILRDEWGFEGPVISDWGATHSIFESVQNGLDLEMPGPAKYYGELLIDAVNNWQIEEATIDQAARRILRLLAQAGKLAALDGGSAAFNGSGDTREHRTLALELAEESITLLKNEGGLLPLRADRLSTLAVIGPNANDARIGGGGSSYLEPHYRISPLDGLRAALGNSVEIRYEQGVSNAVIPPTLGRQFFAAPGLKAEYYNNANWEGEPALTRIDPSLDMFWFGSGPDESINKDEFSARWTGTLKAPGTGTHTLLLTNTDLCRLYIDGQLLMENNTGQRPVHQLQRHPEEATQTAPFEFETGKTYAIKVEMARFPGEIYSHVRLAYIAPAIGQDGITRAAELARQADAAVIFAGMPTAYESESFDRPNMDLPGPQAELIRAVAAANPKTIVVLNAGSPVAMPWIDDVPVVMEAYYPGQEGGAAVARVLLGEVNPSGKLPVTFPRRLEDNPTYTNYPGDRDVRYGEGIFVGYRYYDHKNVEPLFPFGHGLSFTTFEYSNLKVPAAALSGQPVTVSVTIKNSGSQAGKEVVQLYVSDVQASLARPPKELKGFQKVMLQPAESQEISFSLDPRALSFYDPTRRAWVAEPGEFVVMVGSSSRDIRAQAALTLE